MLDQVSTAMEYYAETGHMYPAVFCSFDSPESLEALNKICLSLPQEMDFIWNFLLAPPSDANMHIPDLGKGYIQSILEMNHTELLLIQKIVNMWKEETENGMYELCELISVMSDEVGG